MKIRPVNNGSKKLSRCFNWQLSNSIGADNYITTIINGKTFVIYL